MSISLLVLQGVPWAGSKKLEYATLAMLLILFVLSVILIIQKRLIIRRARKSSKIFAPKVAELFKHNRLDEVLSLSKQAMESSHLAIVVHWGFATYREMEGTLSHTQRMKQMQITLDSALLIRQSELERHFGLLDATGRIAPFIGALGGTSRTFAIGIILAALVVWFVTTVRTTISDEMKIEMKNSSNELTSYLEIKAAMSGESQ